MLQKAVGVTVFAIGVLVVFSAGWLVKRFHLDERVGCEHENEMEEKEIKLYRYNKSVVNIKMAGMLVALPGLVLILLSY